MINTRFALIALIIFVSSNLAFCQERFVEVKIGGSLSEDYSSDPEYNDDRGISTFPYGGVSFYSKTSEKYWFTYGFEYVKLGDVYNYFTGFNSGRTDVDITVNSLKIPLMIGYIGNTDKAVVPIFKIGPSLDFVFGEPKIEPAGELNNPEAFRQNIGQGSVDNPINFGLNASIGAIFAFFDTQLIAEIRYNRFITDPFSNSKFSVIGFSLGVQLPK